MAKLDLSKLEIDWPILFGCFTGIIVFSIILELTISYIELALHDHVHYLAMTRRIFKELTILGIITIVLILLATYADLPDEVFETLEFAHLWLFVAEIAYLFQAVGTMLIVLRVKRFWDESFHHGFVAVLKQYDKGISKKNHCAQQCTMSVLRILFGKRYSEEALLELWIFRQYFVKTHHLPQDFDFGKYLRRSLSKKVVNEIDISWLTWFSMLGVIVIGVLITQFGPNQGEAQLLDINLTMNVCFGCSIFLFVVVTVVMLILFSDRDNLLAVAGVDSRRKLRDIAIQQNAQFTSYSVSNRKLIFYENNEPTGEFPLSDEEDDEYAELGSNEPQSPGDDSNTSNEERESKDGHCNMNGETKEPAVVDNLKLDGETLSKASSIRSDDVDRIYGRANPCSSINVNGIEYTIKLGLHKPEILQISEVVDTCEVQSKENRDVAKSVFLCARPGFLLYLYRLCLLLQCFIVALVILVLASNNENLKDGNETWIVVTAVLVFAIHIVIFTVIIPKLIRNWHLLEAVCVLDSEDLETIEEILEEQHVVHQQVHHFGIAIYNAIARKYDSLHSSGKEINVNAIIEVLKEVYSRSAKKQGAPDVISSSTLYKFLSKEPFGLLITRRESRALLRIFGVPKGMNFCEFIQVVRNSIAYIFQTENQFVRNDRVFALVLILLQQAIDQHENCLKCRKRLPQIVPLSWCIRDEPKLRIHESLLDVKSNVLVYH